jgi:predicted RNase H-like HicB family nuclease
MRYAIIIEKGKSNYSAHVPDLPGCVATGSTLDDVKANMREAIVLHIEEMRDDGQTVPEPSAEVDHIDVAA